MNIKTRLSVQFSLVTFGILLFFSVLVYYFSYSSQRSKFRENLLDRAKNTALLMISVEEVDSTLLRKIHQTTLTQEEEEIAMVDSSNNPVYSKELKYLNSWVYMEYSAETGHLFFNLKEKDAVCYKHNSNDQTYRVFVAAYDRHRVNNLKDLKRVLLWSIVFSFWLSITISYFFSRSAIRPISQIISNVKNINSSKLSNRLDEGKRKDEIDQLAITFNEMLSDLEVVFKNQQEFVSNASHEMRTPLAVMIAETDYLLSRERTPREYADQLSNLASDLRNLNLLVTGLLELAHLNRDNNIQTSEIRIDELIFNAIRLTRIKYKDRKIIPDIDYSENEDDLIIHGNAGLIEIALKNLLENACKFSEQDVVIKTTKEDDYLNINIMDEGIGIPAGERETIFKPFQRGSNTRYIDGFGIGLAIVSKVAELHNARISLTSEEQKGTTITLSFKKVDAV